MPSIPLTRAPRGKPEQVKIIGAKVPLALFKKFHRKGGSKWLRGLIRRAP